MVGTWKIEKMQEASLPEIVATGFATVTRDLVGASYLPVLYVGEQVVKGINYMIICKQTLSDKSATEHIVKMVINSFQNDWSIVFIDTIV